MDLKKLLAIFALGGLLLLYICIYGKTTEFWSIISMSNNNIEAQHGNNQSNAIPSTLSTDIDIVKYKASKNKFDKGIMHFYGKSLAIFIYGKDDLISSNIIQHGIWEQWWVNQFAMYIKSHPGIQVIDLGCNIGVYTMVAASLDCKVFAIDANKNNTDRLTQSVIESKMMDRVTIILNAVSNTRQTFSMHFVPSNIGGQALLDNKNNTYQVKSIFLDDLLPLIDSRYDVIMKMDIEGYEVKAIQAAGNLFDKRNIQLVAMEWFQVKKFEDSYILVHFFLSRNYKPYKDYFSPTVLDISNYKSWPDDIVWRKA